MPKIKIERLLLIIFILMFSLTLLPSLVKRLLPTPQIIQTMPAGSSTNVSSDTQQIRFVFSQPMSPEKDIVFRGMRLRGQFQWMDEQRTILVFPLKEPLKPGAFYSIVLNSSLNSTSGNDNLMKGQWGKPLDEYILTFMTAPSKTMQSRIEKFNSGALRDTDKDGLDDGLEAVLGTLSTTPDTDADGLTDYEEYCKYQTDPTSSDSDGDGTSDADWNERREYTYSIRTVLELKPPWSLEAMNDLFQDARLIGQAIENRAYSKIEVIVYPYAAPVLLPTAYPSQRTSEAFTKYTQPTTDLNYSPEMQTEIQRILSGATHTLDVLARLQHKISQMKLTVPLYAPFVYTYKQQDKLVVDQTFFESIDQEVTDIRRNR